MPTPSMTFEEYVIAAGLIFRAEMSFAGIAAAGLAARLRPQFPTLSTSANP